MSSQPLLSERSRPSIITFDHSAPEVYAGMSAVFYTYSGYSDLVNLKTGDTYVNILSGTYERWGDYTGSQLKYNEPGVVWVSGNFGRAVDLGPFTNRENATWIACLRTPDSLPPVSVVTAPAPSVQIYPNPVPEWVQADVLFPRSGTATFLLWNAQGGLEKHLLTAKAAEGLNRFRFQMNHLAPGSYWLEIRLDQQTLHTQQVQKL